jgi:hypothetical protein
MKKYRKILITAVIFMLAASLAFSSDDLPSIPSLGDLKARVDVFSENIAKSLPFNSMIGLNWSDAHIGQFLGIPPRFGAGFTFGTTLIELASINDLLGVLGQSAPIDLAIGLPLPGYTVEGRIGGFILPFDVGVKLGYIPQFDIAGLGLDYLLLGADLRYSMLPKAIPLLKVSVGLGFNHLSGGISAKIPAGQTFEFSDPAPGSTGFYQLEIEDPTVGLRWQTNVFEVKAQASINLIILTPYLGLGLSYGWSEAGFQVDSKVTMKDPDGNANDVSQDLINQAGFGSIAANTAGIESMVSHGAFNARAFGGVSLNLALVRFDITGMYNFTSGNFGGTFGVRFQI